MATNNFSNTACVLSWLQSLPRFGDTVTLVATAVHEGKQQKQSADKFWTNPKFNQKRIFGRNNYVFQNYILLKTYT